MSEINRNTARLFVLGLACGAAAGTAVALLFAPTSGAELRGRVSASADRLRKTAARAYEDASEAFDSLVNHHHRRPPVDAGRNAVERAVGAFGA